MNLLTQWNELARSEMSRPARPVQVQVEELTQHYTRLWWSCERTLPAFSVLYTPAEQASNEKALDNLINGLIYELKHVPNTTDGRETWQARLRAQAMPFVRQAFHLEQRHLDFIENSGMIEANQEFARMARRFDPAIPGEDIFQAGRNVMTMNFMQLLLGLPVKVTPSVFAYSMLYPYTDNYLDDPAVSDMTKMTFNHRFRARLQGETVRPANHNEEIISELVQMIEDQFDRSQFPQLYESLLAIHTAQERSLRLVAPGASPYELDVLGISFEKGGTSVLADGYLVAGSLSPAQAAMMFGYGAFTQLMDDLEDLQEDMRAHRLTIFSQTAAGRWPLDDLTNRVFHFGRIIFSDLSAFNTPAVPYLKDIMARSIDPILIDSLGQFGSYYSKAYLRQVERHQAYRFAVVKKQRSKLDRQKINLNRLIETFFLEA